MQITVFKLATYFIEKYCKSHIEIAFKQINNKFKTKRKFRPILKYFQIISLNED